MAKEKQKKEPKPIELTKYQKFEAVTIKRSEIKNAPYNPRTISEHARKALKKNIKRVGLLDTPVWNELTKNLVSGHQRLAILDALENGNDYLITVSKVQLSDKEEKEQNIFFNNPTAQGDWDLDLLKKIIPEIEWEFTGFDEKDFAIFDIETSVLSNTEENEEAEDIINDMDNVIADRMAQRELVKEKRKEYKKEQDKINNADNYVVLLFKDEEDKYEFLEKYGLNFTDSTYINKDAFERVIAEYYLKRT